MKRQALVMAGAALLLATAAAGCNGTTSTTTPATPAPALANVAGQYRGTVADTAFGNGKALGDFSQTGSTVGGRLRLTYAGKKVLNSVAMTLARSGALSGDAVATIGQTACTFSVSANLRCDELRALRILRRDDRLFRRIGNVRNERSVLLPTERRHP